MAENTQQAPVTNRGGIWGNNRFQNYYNQYLNTLPLNTVSYDRITTPDVSVDEIANDVNAYLEPQIDTTQKNLRREMRRDYNDIDANIAGRGVSRSTIGLDAKNATYNAGMNALTNAWANYQDELANGVAQRYEQLLARRQAADEQNAKNQFETDKYNSQVLTAQEQLAYQRANEAFARTQPSGGGGRGSSPSTKTETPQKQGYYGTLTAGSTGSSSAFGAQRNQVVRMTDGGGGGKSIKHSTSGSTKVQPVYKSSKKVSK